MMIRLYARHRDRKNEFLDQRLEKVWSIVQVDLPELETSITQLLQELGEEDGKK